MACYPHIELKNKIAICINIVTLAIWVVPCIWSQKKADVYVPLVGCEAYDQAETFKAPERAKKTVSIDASATKMLAYYKAEYFAGVLAPRGWNCLAVNGSGGSVFLVTPQPLKIDFDLNKITGPAIQVNEYCSDNSGRFDIARVIARAFPKQKTFVQNMLKFGDLPASDFPFGPYPKDKMVRRNDWIVEYRTPANSEGLGTIGYLPKADLPTEGIAILRDQSPDCLLFMAVRLPPDMSDLAPQIIQQMLRENGKKEKH
jgi:hypothetical protein